MILKASYLGKQTFTSKKNQKEYTVASFLIEGQLETIKLFINDTTKEKLNKTEIYSMVTLHLEPLIRNGYITLQLDTVS